ncbi:hypothetical protein JCM10449v2_004314 [Rhodotorula kratochvilovae]
MSRTIEDNDPSVGYTGPWGHYNTPDGAVNASVFSSGTVSVCGTVAWDGGNCEARIPFNGTGISIFGDSGGQRGQFYCRLETASGVPEGLWTWRDAGAYSWGYRTKVPLCMVSSIPNGSHVAVLGVYVGDVVRGTSFDFAITNQTAPPGNKYIWDSVLADAVPPLPFRNTTDLPLVPAFTAVPSPVDYKTDSYVYTSAPYSSSSKAVPLGVGLGVGLGGAVLLALLAALWLLRRRGRARRAAAAEAEAGEETLHGGDDGAKETETPLAVIVDGPQEEGRFHHTSRHFTLFSRTTARPILILQADP